MKASVTPRKCETSTQPHSIAVNMVNADGGNFVASGNREAGCYKLGLLSLCNQVSRLIDDDDSIRFTSFCGYGCPRSLSIAGVRPTTDVHIGEVCKQYLFRRSMFLDLPLAIIIYLPTVFREVTTRGEQ